MESHTLKIVILVQIFAVIPVLSAKQKHGPHFSDNMTTTCEEFTQFARFNPYTMFNETWFVFYYWGPLMNTVILRFTPVTTKQYKILHKHLDGKYSPPVNWTARHFMMWHHREMALLVEKGDRGQFLLYSTDREPKEKMKLKPYDIRFKQTGDNMVVGLLFCMEEKLYAMSRVEDVPRQKDLQEVAARLKYRGRGGKSYLYQGHQWMPIPEQNEFEFWAQRRKHRFMY